MNERGEAGDKETEWDCVWKWTEAIGGFIYLEHLWRTAGLPQRQPWPETALSSCLALKGQQRINQSENKERKCVEAAHLWRSSLCQCAVTRQHMQEMKVCLIYCCIKTVRLPLMESTQWKKATCVVIPNALPIVFYIYRININSNHIIIAFHYNKKKRSI